MLSNRYIQFVTTIAAFILMMYSFDAINSWITFIANVIIVSIISWKFNEVINRYLVPKHIISSSGRAVIITGCDTGFGNELVFKLNRLGFHIIATCLNTDSEGAKQLLDKVVLPNRLSIIELDVTNDSHIQTSFETISDILRDNGLELWALINNSGVFHIGFVEWDNNIDSYNRLFNVNTLGAIRLTRKYLPLLRQSGGRVINVLSAASRLAMEGTSAYSASKFATLAFTDALRREIFRFGVKVISVEPSIYRTPMSGVQTVHKLVDNIWSNTPTDIQKEYGIHSFENFKLWYAKQVNRARPPSEVVSALTDSVINARPQTRYRCCGLLVSMIWSFGELLPSEVFDDFIRFVNRFEVLSK